MASDELAGSTATRGSSSESAATVCESNPPKLHELYGSPGETIGALAKAVPKSPTSAINAMPETTRRPNSFLRHMGVLLQNPYP